MGELPMFRAIGEGRSDWPRVDDSIPLGEIRGRLLERISVACARAGQPMPESVGAMSNAPEWPATTNVGDVGMLFINGDMESVIGWNKVQPGVFMRIAISAAESRPLLDCWGVIVTWQPAAPEPEIEPDYCSQCGAQIIVAHGHCGDGDI